MKDETFTMHFESPPGPPLTGGQCVANQIERVGSAVRSLGHSISIVIVMLLGIWASSCQQSCAVERIARQMAQEPPK